MTSRMEKDLCPSCGQVLQLKKCLSETEAIMKCKHCGKKFNIKHDAPVYPYSMDGFNWGGFLIPMWWCFGHKLYKSALLILFLGISGLFIYWDELGAGFVAIGLIGSIIFWPMIIILSIYYGVKGNVIAWNRINWTSKEHFKRVQRRWTIGGIILNVIVFFINFISACSNAML